MIFIESRLLGVQIDDLGSQVVLSFKSTEGTPFRACLCGVERLLVNEMRQQNVVEEIRFWNLGESFYGLREALFALLTGTTEKEASPSLLNAVEIAQNRVMRGELELLEITAVYGAQVLASFASIEFSEHVGSIQD